VDHRIFCGGQYLSAGKNRFGLVSSESVNADRDLLWEIGSPFPNFTGGWTGDEVLSSIEPVTHERFQGAIGIAVLNFPEGKH
jgi:hypothetical protein